MKTRTKESKRRLHSLILLTAFTAVLLIVSTYAWFTTQKNIAVKNIRGKVEVAEGMEISLDAKKWVQTINLGDADTSLTVEPGKQGEDGTTIQYGPYNLHNNMVPSQFTPVSTSGEIESDFDDAAQPSDDNMDNIVMYAGAYAGTQLTDARIVKEGKESGDEPDGYANYFAFDIFIRNSSKNGAAADKLELDAGSSAWVVPSDGSVFGENYAGNKHSGLQNTIRVGIAKYGSAEAGGHADYIAATTSQNDILSKARTQKISTVAIWEPNADAHAQTIMENVKEHFDVALGADHGILKTTDPKDNNSELCELFFTATLNKKVLEGDKKVENVFNWKKNAEGKFEVDAFSEPKTLQTKEATDGVLPGTKDIKDIAGNDVKIAPNSVTRFRIYVWIEGQDPDCINFASYGGGVDVNLGFTKNSGNGGNESIGGEENEEENVAVGG